MYKFESMHLRGLKEIQDRGINPYPHNISVTHTLSEVLEKIGERSKEELAEDTSIVNVAGRVMLKRKMGKAGFATLQDPTGNLQVYVSKNAISPEDFEQWKSCGMGDHVQLTGTFFRTQTGEPTIQAQTFQLAAKCITSLPDKHKGLQDVETRSRSRYVDLFMNEESRETFRRRSQIVSFIRRFFEDRSYMEVETPMLQVIPGGAAARPFQTHHNALGLDMFLRIAPELYLKRLVVGGFHKVFEINRNFRNEGISTQHNPEFTMLEFYAAYHNWQDLMNLTEEMIAQLAQNICGSTSVVYGDHTLEFASPWRRLPFTTAVSEATGLSEEACWDPQKLHEWWLQNHPTDTNNPKLPTTVGKWFEWIFDAHIESQLIQPTFLTHFPTEISPLSRRSDNNPLIADRFELFIAGREIANGFNELNDPVDQAGRFESQAKAKDAGDDEAMYFDSDYITALTYGMPPTAGEGIGIDRLVMLLTNAQSIREVILFPTLKPKK